MEGGKKDENECQVGYSDVIRQLLKDGLKGKAVTCKINGTRTILSSHCPARNFDKEMETFSTAVSRISFARDQVDKAISSTIEQYHPEKMNSRRLSAIYRNFILYGTKNPLGRNYCQYQLERALPEELREFYMSHYSPQHSCLLVCGNFNLSQVKKTITKHFLKWRPFFQETNGTNTVPEEIPEIKNRSIAFVNKRDLEHYLLTWVLSAPSARSTDHVAFTVTCHLFDRYLAYALKETGNKELLKFKPVSEAGGFMELEGIAGPNELVEAMACVDTSLFFFHKLKISAADLEEVIIDLKNKTLHNVTAESILSFYNPLLYNFEQRKNYLNALAAIKPQDIQRILITYFRPDAYNLIIVGKDHAAFDQRSSLRSVTHYRALDFETCDEACKEVVVVKCHCESCYRRGQCYVWRFNPKDKNAIKSARSRAKASLK